MTNKYFTNPITNVTNAFYTVPEAHAAFELIESGFDLLPSPTDLRNAIQNGFELRIV